MVVVGQTYSIVRFVVGSFRLDFIILTEGSIQDSFCEIWEHFADNYTESLIMSHGGGGRV